MHKNGDRCIDIPIADKENELNVTCPNDCYRCVHLYTDVDRDNMLKEQYSWLKQVSIDIDDIKSYKFICGNGAHHVDDMDAIGYEAGAMLLVKRNRCKDLPEEEFCEAVYTLKRFGWKVNKRLLRRYRRLKPYCTSYNSYHSPKKQERRGRKRAIYRRRHEPIRYSISKR